VIFRRELVEKICQAHKTQTRRLTSMNPNSPWYAGGCRYKAGGIYAVQPGRSEHGVARIKLTAEPRLELLGVISEADARAEGFVGRDDFIRYWREMHGSFPEAVEVWVLEFALVDRVGYDQEIEDTIAAAEIQQDISEQDALDAKLRERPHETRYDG